MDINTFFDKLEIELTKMEAIEERKKYLKLLKETPDEKKDEQFSFIIEQLKLKNNLSQLNEYIEILPAELRLKYIDLYDFEQYNSHKSIIENVDNEEIIFKLLSYALIAEKDVYNVYNIFECVPQKYKEKFLILIVEKEKTLQKNIIEAYNVKDYILSFDIEQRSHIIKNVLFKDFEYNNDNKKIIELMNTGINIY